MSEARRGLGRGLSVLLGDERRDESGSMGDGGHGVRMLPVAAIHANPDQPRRHFDAAALDELAGSIAERGLLQPIVVRPRGGAWEIVAGERRWRAAQQAGLHEMPVVVREFDDRDAFEIAIIENIQRAELNPIEEAEGYSRLVSEHGHTIEAVAKAVGKSRPYVSNLMRLLELPHDLRDMVIEGRLSASHARTVISHDDAVELAQKAVANGWSVRQLENAARKPAPNVELKPANARVRTGSHDPNLVALEQSLASALGVTVQVIPGDDPSSGTLTVKYSDLQQLDMICQRLLGDAGHFG